MGSELAKEQAEVIFKEHSNYIFRLALFLTKSKELADDITQETFIRVFRKYDTYDTSKPIQPWIYKIALNVTRNMLRKQKWLKFMSETPENHGWDFVESTILKNEAENELWRQINHLDLKSREVIMLHFYSGLKLKEISDSIGIPLGTCKSRLNYALNTLRKQLPESEFSILSQGGEIYETIHS